MAAISEELFMRPATLQRVFLSGLAISAFLPSMMGAQVRPPTPQRTTGSGQPWQCLPSDSIRAFNRTLRADSLAREEGLFAGVSAGAVAAVCVRIANEMEDEKKRTAAQHARVYHLARRRLVGGPAPSAQCHDRNTGPKGALRS